MAKKKRRDPTSAKAKAKRKATRQARRGGAPKSSTPATAAAKKGKKGKKKNNKPAPAPEPVAPAVADTPIASSIAGVEGGGTPQEDINQLIEEISIGEQLGQSIIDTFGLGGDFLGRVSDEIGPEAAEALALAQELAGKAGDLTDLELEALEEARAALEGLDATEVTALREAAEQEIDTQLAVERRNIASVGGRRGVRGAASQAADLELARGRFDAQSDLERDLIIENVNQRNLARGQFTDLATGVTQNQFNRSLAANDAFARNAQLADAFRQNAQLANIGLGAQEVGTRVGTQLGAIGTATGLLGGFRAEDFAEKSFDESLAAQKESEDKQLKFANKALKSQNNVFNEFAGQFGL